MAAALHRIAEQANFKLPLPGGVTFLQFFGITQAELDGEPRRLVTVPVHV